MEWEQIIAKLTEEYKIKVIDGLPYVIEEQNKHPNIRQAVKGSLVEATALVLAGVECADATGGPVAFDQESANRLRVILYNALAMVTNDEKLAENLRVAEDRLAELAPPVKF